MEPNKAQSIPINRPGSSSRNNFGSNPGNLSSSSANTASGSSAVDMSASITSGPSTSHRMHRMRPMHQTQPHSTLAREIPLTTPGRDDTPLEEPAPQTSSRRANQGYQKKHKAGTIALFIIAAVAVLGVGVAAGIFVDREFLNKENDNKEVTSSVEEIPAVSQPETAVTETAVADATTTEDLTKKIKILFSDFNTDVAGSIDTTTLSGSTVPDYSTAGKIVDGLTDVEKLGTALAYTYISNGYYQNDIETGTTNSIPASEVDTAYVYLFGIAPTHQNASGNWCTGEFTYDAETSSYTTTGPACGGTLEPRDYFYISDFTTDGSKLYAYVSAGSSEYNVDGDAVTMNIYDDVTAHPDRQLIETVETFGSIDASNYNNFANYRFVFTQGADGSYYFETVEKI